MKVLLLGDICPCDDSVPHFAKSCVKELFGDTVSLTLNKDVVFANLECAITDSDNAIKKFGPNLKAPMATAGVLKEFGVTLAGLSNNHSFDFGIPGIKDTLAALDEAGIAYTGFGDDLASSRKNYTVVKNGERICFMTVCEHEYTYALEDRMGARPYDEYDTMEDIRAARAISDRVIVIYHGGKEQSEYPSPRLLKLCRAMVKNGADVVLCQHSHCIGCYENYEGGHILYGQGNFHFAMKVSFENWYNGFAVEYDTQTGKIEFIPVVLSGHKLSLAKGEEKDSILRAFEDRSAKLGTGEWRQGWHEFCERVAYYYREAIGRAMCEDSTERENAIFGHYLDCEAHTDVWRELFPTYNQTNEK